MAKVTRRAALGAGLGLTAGAVLAGCGLGDTASDQGNSVPESHTPTGPTSGAPSGKVLGDGSYADTGPQPHQPTVRKLKAGETPPQFVVISWDGAGELTGLDLLSHFRHVAHDTGASMTLFLTGLFFLPRSKRMLYRPPHHPRGASDVGWMSDHDVHATIENIGKAWKEGHEIGTHFNGHFCGANGVGKWSPADWTSEIDQAKYFVTHWRTTTGFTDLPPLPFDYDKELIGGRTPCLDGADNLRKAARRQHWRYDSSMTGIQMWPHKDGTLWDLSMQSIPFAGHQGQVISMDYNIMYNQTKPAHGATAKRPEWQKQAEDTYLAGFRRAYDGNRAPLIIGNHFEGWRGGIYMKAVEKVMRTLATYPDTRMVSFRQLCDWLDAQDPKVLDKLRTIPTGQRPVGGWKTFLRASA